MMEPLLLLPLFLSLLPEKTRLEHNAIPFVGGYFRTDRLIERERGTVLSRGAQWSFFFFLELSSGVSIASDVDIICT